jgi:hypothetical protein
MALVLTPKQDDTMTVAGNGPVRFYIVHTIAGQTQITPSNYVWKSPFAIVQEDWRVALPKMAQRYPGRGEGLEIDCHGLPGILLLNPQVNLTSLHNFADAVRGLLQPYGLVEFLACQVANYDVPALAQYLGSMGRKADAQFLSAWLHDSGKLPDWKGDVNSLEGRPDPEVSAHMKRIREEGLQAGKSHILKCPYGAGTVQATTWQSAWDEANMAGGARGLVLAPKGPARPTATRPATNLDHVRVAQLAIQSGLLEIGDNYNGPLFCSRAASLLRCTVRASMASQSDPETSGMSLDEFLRTYNYKVMPAASWSGHIFEFSPAGKVAYIGFDVPRPVYVPMTPGMEGPLRPA